MTHVLAEFPVIDVDDPEDTRLADYRSLKERHLHARSGRFVAESERVVRRLLASRLDVDSVLLTPTRLEAMGDALAGPPPRRAQAALPPKPIAGGSEPSEGSEARIEASFPVYRASPAVLDAIAGFHVHRGCLAIGRRPPPRPLPAEARAVVVLEDLVDVDNLGAVARNAVAFGADALLLSPRCADPFYRKAIRVSLGAVFELPIVRLARWPDDLLALRAQGFSLVAAALTPDATPLPRFAPPARWALLLGAEGPGLSAGALAASDHRVVIPMSPSTGADSLNVANASAVMLYALMRRG